MSGGFVGRPLRGSVESIRSCWSFPLGACGMNEPGLAGTSSQASDVGSIPIARSISLDDSADLTRLSC